MTCPECKAPFTCEKSIDCWCMEIPPKLVNGRLSCYCRNCLLKKEDKSTSK